MAAPAPGEQDGADQGTAPRPPQVPAAGPGLPVLTGTVCGRRRFPAPVTPTSKITDLDHHLTHDLCSELTICCVERVSFP
jgi:hypothetical protein